MPSASRTITIDRPPATVHAFFANHANDPRWRSGIHTIEPVDGGAPGTRIRQVVRGPGGRGIDADIEVTANDPPARYAFRAVAGPVRPRGEYRFAAAGAGTEVRFSLDAELTGLKRLLMGRMVQGSMDGEMHGLDTAKRILEAS